VLLVEAFPDEYQGVCLSVGVLAGGNHGVMLLIEAFTGGHQGVVRSQLSKEARSFEG
jgi:tRNA G37 N-methylase TrmD